MGVLEKSDVVYMYSHARDKHEEISILAELTASDIETIIEVLKEAEQPIEGKFKPCAKCKTLIPYECRGKMCEKCRCNVKAMKRYYRIRGGISN